MTKFDRIRAEAKRWAFAILVPAFPATGVMTLGEKGGLWFWWIVLAAYGYLYGAMVYWFFQGDYMEGERKQAEKDRREIAEYRRRRGLDKEDE